MRVFYSGFNLYKHFIKDNNLIVPGFKECIDLNEQENVEDVELHHTYSILCKKSYLVVCTLQGMKEIHVNVGIEIAQASCTDKMIVVLTTQGSLFKLNLEKSDDEFIPIALPQIINEEDKFIKISYGSKINTALTKEGKVYSLPNQSFCNKGIIVDICSGIEHSVMLDKDGLVYTCGRGSRGQLGHGNLDDEIEPRLVNGLCGIKIIKIAAGGWHSCAISAEGDLYTWGWNANGQLGLGEDFSVMASPHVVELENDELIAVDVACGYRHTVVATSSGQLFGSGWNKYCQLGDEKCFDHKENVFKMCFLWDFNKKDLRLKCGPWSTAVLILN